MIDAQMPFPACLREPRERGTSASRGGSLTHKDVSQGFDVCTGEDAGDQLQLRDRLISATRPVADGVPRD